MANAKKIRIGGTSHDIEDSAARTSIGTLSNLNTTAKTNLVAAINENTAAASDLKSNIDLYDNAYNILTDSDLTPYHIEIGSLVSQSGINYGSSTRLRTGLIDVGKGSVIRCKDTTGYGVIVYRYQKDGTFIGTDNTWSSSYTVPEDCKIRVLMRHSDNAEITSADIAELITHFEIIAVYPSLGREVTTAEKDYVFEWEHGTIAGGIPSASQTYARTKEYVYAPKGSIITLYNQSQSYVCSIYMYALKNTENYISASSVIPVTTDPKYFVIPNDCYIRLRFAYGDYHTLTDAELNIQFIYIFRNVISDTIGNIVNTINDTISANAPAIYKPWENAVVPMQETQGKSFTIGIQSDTHFAIGVQDDSYLRNLPMLSYYFGMDIIANLGDVIQGYTNDTLAESRANLTEAMHRYLIDLNCPLMVAIGNHDDSVLTTESGNRDINEIMSKNELYAKIMKPQINTLRDFHDNGLTAYYYSDFEQCRVIMLNTRDLPYQAIGSTDVSINHHAISAEQITWFTNVALNTTKPIIVMCHVPLVSDLIVDGYGVDNASQIISALNTFVANGGTAICLYGHTHAQTAVKLNGINHITFSAGGYFAEIVFVNFDNETIETKMIGNYGTRVNRSFTI